MDPRLTELRALRVRVATGQMESSAFETQRLYLIDAMTGTVFPSKGATSGEEVIGEDSFAVRDGGPSHETVLGAAFSNNLDMLKRFIADGGSVNSREAESLTSILMIAAGRGFGKLVEWYGLFLTQQKPRRRGGGEEVETFQRTWILIALHCLVFLLCNKVD